ncbi:Ig-like domain-containing protein [Paenibacillus sp. YPG26]|uniref:Ig-like domain-containing protein n=1 Tax=Paenibacillus sp. YPG26 TaxID=2878915 RepID=UPI00203C78BF|nr:Ig-like domain-containing protein [Paenibacillus sp. YPG26]USB31923.1 Ig-like domain-containing protein [Paenibacillus sp. YPG26]
MFHTIVRKSAYLITSLAVVSGIIASPGLAADSEQKPPVIEWSHAYGKGQLSVNGRSVTPTPDGGYIVAGEFTGIDSSSYGITKAYILKVNASGQKEWEQKVDHKGAEYNYAHKAVPTKDGGYIVSGATKSYEGKPHNVVYLVKLDATGNVVWEKEYGDGYTNQYGESVVESEDGGFVVTGYSVTSSGEAPAYVLKTDAQGNKLWYKKFRYDDNQYFNDLIATPDGGTINVGTINTMFGPGTNDASVATKLDANGEEVWVKKYVQSGSKRSAFSIISTDEGDYIIASRTRDDKNILTRIAANGEVIWEKTYDPTPDRELFTQVVRTQDGYALLGENQQGTYPDDQSQFEVLKVDKNGEVKDHVLFGEPNLYSIGRGTASPDGGLVLTGQANQGEDYYLQLTKLAAKEAAEPTVTEIAFSDSTKTIEVGKNTAVTLNALYSDGTKAGVSDSVTYTSEDESIASVDGTGLITGNKPGSTTITADYKGLNAHLQVNITAAGEPGSADGIFYLDSDEYSLTAGTSLDTIAVFKDKNGQVHNVTKQAVFKSENPKVAEYDKDGNIIGVHAGITHVIAEYNGQTYKALVQVVRAYVPR